MDVEESRRLLGEAVAEARRTALDNAVLRGGNLDEAAVARFEVTQDLAEQITADVLRHGRVLVDRELLAYDPAYQTSAAQVLVEPLAEVPQLARVDALVRSGDLPDDAADEPVVAMAHRVSNGTATIVAYRLKGPGIATRRPRGIFLGLRDGRYEPVTGEVLVYENRFDALTVGGFVYFTSVQLIQTKLHAEDKARRLATETLRRATAQVGIEGLDQLELAVTEDPSMRAKMASLARLLEADEDYATRITTEALVAFAEAHPVYDIAVAERDGAKALRFDASPQKRFQIPKLLADDYLHSFLTDRDYEAGSKSRLHRPET